MGLLSLLTVQVLERHISLPAQESLYIYRLRRAVENMEVLCARLKKLAVQLEGLSPGEASNETRSILEKGLLALMELKSVFRTVCLATEEVSSHTIMHWVGSGLLVRWAGTLTYALLCRSDRGQRPPRCCWIRRS